MSILRELQPCPKCATRKKSREKLSQVVFAPDSVPGMGLISIPGEIPPIHSRRNMVLSLNHRAKCRREFAEAKGRMARRP
jgi:hypothetical protein